jgi:hypothetical protein
MSQREHRKMHDISLPVSDPPSSPPNIFLLAIRVMKQTRATITKTTTLNPRAPAGT